MTAVGRFSLPLARPLSTAEGTIDCREGFLLRIGDAPAGIGEATPLPGWTESIEACRVALDSELPAAADLESLEGLPELADAPAARHGLELAVLDRIARAGGVPLYRLLGGDRRVSTVSVNATVGDDDVEATVAEAAVAARAGFPTIKLKVGARAIEADLGRVAAVREAVGDAVELRVDANGAWSAGTAAEAIDRLAALDVAVVEQPLDPASLAANADLRGRGPAIALDETLRARPIDAIVEAGAADLVVLKPMALGGVVRARDLAERVRDRGMEVIITTTVDAAVARTAAVHLAAALDVGRACGLATADWLADDVADDPAPVVDGGASVPQGAGHGVGVEDLE